MSSQVERGTVREMVHTIAFRAGVLERILQEPVLGGLEIRSDELAHVHLLQRQIDDLRRYLNLPSAEPGWKTGEWIKHENPTLGQCLKIVYDCSVCHMGVGCEYFIRRSFCPNCGADMRGEDGKA